QRAHLVTSEKCAVGWGSDDDEIRMITANFVRAVERFAGDLCLHFPPLFQQVVVIRKTCNQLRRTPAVIKPLRGTRVLRMECFLHKLTGVRPHHPGQDTIPSTGGNACTRLLCWS